MRTQRNVDWGDLRCIKCNKRSNKRVISRKGTTLTEKNRVTLVHEADKDTWAQILHLYLS